MIHDMEEFSYLIRAGQIKDQPQEYDLTANAAQCQALAQRFGLETIPRLRGRFCLKHERSGVIAARLTMRAEVVQVCVVTLEAFSERVEEDVDLRFVPASMLNRPANADDDEEEDITPESFDSPDEIFFENDQIDLGATLAEQLALALNPYPRKPGATLSQTATDNSAHPFASLVGKFGKKAGSQP